MKVIFCMLSFLHVGNIFFDGFGQVCPKYSDKFAIFLGYPKKAA